jgi:hypothetical protein
MTSDQAYQFADSDLDNALVIWESRDKSRYDLAEESYRRAVVIRDKFFPDEILKDLIND